MVMMVGKGMTHVKFPNIDFKKSYMNITPNSIHTREEHIVTFIENETHFFPLYYNTKLDILMKHNNSIQQLALLYI